MSPKLQEIDPSDTVSFKTLSLNPSPRSSNIGLTELPYLYDPPILGLLYIPMRNINISYNDRLPALGELWKSELDSSSVLVNRALRAL